MTRLDLLEVNQRGDENFDALTEIEKDLYVLVLFFHLRDMEGITHFFSHHAHHVPRLLAFLAAAKAANWRAVSDLAEFLRTNAGRSWDPEALDDCLCRLSSEDLARISTWDGEYYSKAQDMWRQVKEYVRQCHGVDFD
jgi:hypothetical protein